MKMEIDATEKTENEEILEIENLGKRIETTDLQQKESQV